jgi:CelD/BcsL family acetyltransferase involved in cellulose biosynthesis
MSLAPPPVRAIVCGAARLPGEMRRRWAGFCGARFSSRSFLTPDFAAAVAGVHPGARVAALMSEGEPVAFFPFQFASRWHAALGWAEPLASGLSDYFGIACADGFSVTPEALLKAAGLSFMHFTHLDEAQAIAGLSGERPEKGLLIVLDQGPEAYWRSLTERDRDFVKDTERRIRQLQAAFGPVLLRVHAEDAPAALDRLIAAKRAQYDRSRVGDPLCEPWTRNLLHALLRSTSGLCRPHLISLYAGDTWVASHFGLMCANRLHYWFPVYSTELKRYAPGRALLTSIINRAPELGIGIIDRGAGDSAAKRDFANGEHLFHRGVWRTAGPRSLFASAGQSLLWRLRA